MHFTTTYHINKERHVMKKLLLVLCILALSCTEDEMILVKQFALTTPANAPAINRGALVSPGGGFEPGWQNGNIRSNRVTITWQGAGDPQFLAYRVFRNNFPVGSFIDPAATTFTDSNLVQSQFYRYQVAVQNQEGNHRSDTITVKTPLFLSPGLSGQLQADTSVLLTWTRRAESAMSYRVERAASGGAFSQLATPTDTFYTDRSAVYGATYQYRVSAFNQFESTAASNVVVISLVFLVNDGFESGTLPAGWTTGGSLSWAVSNVTPISGAFSPRSGAITHSQSSFIQRTVSFVGTRRIRFLFRVSSEQTNDYLRFLVNGVQSGSNLSGETGVQPFTTTVTGAGTVTLRWEYIKNASGSSGSDAAWIDNVIVQ
jgi:hypothetical protein